MYEIDESEINSKFYDLCRLCASYDNVKISVFSEEGKRRQLRKKIHSCLPFKVDENDGLPKSLCYKCVYNLETTYEFRYKCIQVNRNLEKHLQKKEKDTQSQNVGSGQSHRIHPEVSIFAIPAEHNDCNQNSDESLVAQMESEEGSPNPLDFLEVGTNSEDGSNLHLKTNAQESKKSLSRRTDKRWLSVEPKPLNNDVTNDSKVNAAAKYFDCTQDENSSRRKSCNPRRIARENEDNDSTTCTLPTPGLISLKADCLSENTNSVEEKVTVDAFKSTGTTTMTTTVAAASVTRNAATCSAVTDVNKNNDRDERSSEATTAEQKTFTCLLCEKSFSLRSSLNKHFSTIHGIEPYEVMSQTPLLSQSSFMKEFTEDKNDEELESMMEQETVIFCEVCRREFQDRASLWLHMVHAHREEASVSCGICLKICCDNITLIEHVNTAHSGDKAVVQRRYSCQVCGRQHDSRQKLLKHATLHTLIDNQGQTIQPEEMVSLNNAFAPRECPICHKKFFNEEKLNHHTQNFHNETNDTTLSPSTVYKCELCTSAHATRMDRWWHMYHSHNGDLRVTCDRAGCRKIFVSPALKDEHAKTHHQTQGNFTNTCEICGKLWESRTVFYKHMMNVHPKCLPTICGICMKIFSNVPELRSHVQGDHPPLEECGGICCDVCGRPYAERSKMLRHRRVHNVTDGVPFATSTAKKKDDLVCSFCPQICFERYEDIADHRRTVHQLFVCDLCPKFYNGNNHLWKHVSKQHKGDPSVTCSLCLRTSASRAHLQRHKLKYHSDPVDKLAGKQQQQQSTLATATAAAAAAAAVSPSSPHKCNLCGKLFRIRSLLKKHAKSCKGVKPIVPKIQPINGVFPCSKCNKVFELQNVLYKHMKNSHVQHVCEACETEPRAAFDTKKALLQHIREQHANHRELACDVPGCGKVLRLKADLKKHKLEHVRGYFTYICEICGDMFSNRKKLRKHLQTYHKSDVKYLCAVCVAIHQSVDELISHVHGTHTFVLHRPYTCQICGKCWSVSSKVVEHIGKVHGKEYKPCKICWKVFTDERAFDQHMDNHPAVEEKSPPAPPQSPSPSRKAENRSRTSAASKSGLPQELLALGVSFETDGSVKRPLEDNDGFDGGGGGDSDNASKRLRRRYKCVWCKDTFRSTDELKEHRLTQHANRDTSGEPLAYEEDEPPCENFVAASAVVAEEKHESNKFERWTDIRPIACDCCDKIWNSKKQLWQHLIRSHPYESQHTCGICLQVCRDYYDLFYHLDAQHSDIVNETANRFSCFVCGHYHNSQSKLDKHFSLHKNAPPRCEYTCQYCRKVYKSMAFYRDHIRLHEQPTPLESKTKPLSEFSGFSINHILSTKNERNFNAAPASAATVIPVKSENVANQSENQRKMTSFNDGVYDSEYRKINEENDDDLVEELDEDDEDDENSDSNDNDRQNDSKSSSSPTFTAYQRSSSFSHIKAENQREQLSYVNDSVCDDNVTNAAAAAATVATVAILNGGNDSSLLPISERRPSCNVNNNQKQISRPENDKRNLRNSVGDDRFCRVTDDL